MSAHTAPEPAATGGTGPRRVRVHHLAEAKERGEKITMLTAYDAVTARIFDDAGIDMLLVGDSIGNTMHGHASTLPVTVDDLIPPARAVARAARRAPTPRPRRPHHTPRPAIASAPRLDSPAPHP